MIAEALEALAKLFRSISGAELRERLTALEVKVEKLELGSAETHRLEAVRTELAGVVHELGDQQRPGSVIGRLHKYSGTIIDLNARVRALEDRQP